MTLGQSERKLPFVVNNQNNESKLQVDCSKRHLKLKLNSLSLIGSPRGSSLRKSEGLDESPSKLSILTGSMLERGNLPLSLHKKYSNIHHKILQLDGSSHELLLSPTSRTALGKSPVNKDPYVPVTVLNMKNQRDFSRISGIITDTYDAKEAKDINAYKHELEKINRSFFEHKKRLKHNPFGVFGGSPEKRLFKYGIPFAKLSEQGPLIDQFRDRKTILPPINQSAQDQTETA